MKNFFTFSTKDPEHLESVMAPIIGRVRVRPVKAARFNATVCVKQSNRLSVFTVYADSIRIDAEPPHCYTGLHLPLGRPFTVTVNAHKARFLHDIYLLQPDRPLTLEARGNSRLLAANLYNKALQEYALKLTTTEKPSDFENCNRIEISSPPGLLMACGLANLWSELRRVESEPKSNNTLMELEDTFLTRLETATETASNEHRDIERGKSAQAVARAEDYLNARLTRTVSRADLAAAARVSIRTLSREFHKRHGTGPMQYLKARRLDATYRELLGGEADSTKVTEVALRYGFNHLGKFAIAYKQAFGESPSVTLNR